MPLININSGIVINGIYLGVSFGVEKFDGV